MTITYLAVVAALASAMASAPLAADGGQQHMMHDVSPALTDLVRQATAQFRDVRVAMDAGYGQFLGCVSGPQEGAMGVHFVNGPLVGDGELDVNHPEALVYEPRNGGLRLVAAEYVVIAADWHKNHADPPVLAGQAFQFVDAPNRFGLPAFYELHVWAWRENPHGAYVDWNTHVTCEGE